MRTNVDLAPYRRSTVGFDMFFDVLEKAYQIEPVDQYPPFKVERIGEDQYRIAVAVAGFAQDELDVEVKDGLLTVSGRKRDEQDRSGQYLHRGIATRAFGRQFQLADFVKVRGAELRDGLLVIDLFRDVPEAMKRRRVPIGGNVHPLTSQKPCGQAVQDRKAA